MDHKVTITYEDNCIQARLNGAKQEYLDTKHWGDIVKLCNEYKCYSVLKITNTSVPISSNDILSHTDVCQQFGIDKTYRVAWVELNTHAFNTIRLIQTVLSSNGVPCRVFPSITDAKKWLFYGSDM